MNDRIYQWGIEIIGALQKIEVLATPLTAFSRIWLRHRKIRRFLQREKFDAVIDGGANIGEFASLVRSALPSARLLCVEPHAPSVVRLKAQGFEVVEAALWHEKALLNLSQPNAATTSCTVMDDSSAQSLGTWEVQGMRLADLPVEGKKIFIKLDLQGAEIHALQGMGELWDRCHALMLEVSLGAAGNYETLRRLLAEKGFREYSTTNELEVDNQVVEADKIWLKTKF